MLVKEYLRNYMSSTDKLNDTDETLKYLASKNIIKKLVSDDFPGIGEVVAKRLYEVFEDKAVEILRETPYKAARLVKGIGFETADNIALKYGLSEKSDERIDACISYVLDQAEVEGHVFLFEDELSERVNKYLKFEINLDDRLLDLHIKNEIKIVADGGINGVKKRNAKENGKDDDISNGANGVGNLKKKIYLAENYYIEHNLSEALYRMKDNISIITGGPGTGKTYNIKKIIDEAEENGQNIYLAAPTGRAAKRITEVTGVEARTIHRLLEFRKTSEEVNGRNTFFMVNENNPLDCDLLIIDEMSMVDMKLMFNLMKAVKDKTRLVLVGDVDQLPSVGCGEVLKDMIESGLFNVMKLTKIYRQDEDSEIIKNSHKVNNGEIFEIDNAHEDFKFVRKFSGESIKDAVKKLVVDILPEHFNVDIQEIQVICPSKKQDVGADNLNLILQDAINPFEMDKPEVRVAGKTFRLNDKVMQIKNNYNLRWTKYDSEGFIVKDEGDGVFNGDIGKIVDIDLMSDLITIMFDDREVIYKREEMKDLALGYAITVHKSQGSEYDVVVVPMGKTPYPLLNRKILYTAMTRAKKCIIFIGMDSVFYTMIKNKYNNKRNTALCSKERF